MTYAGYSVTPHYGVTATLSTVFIALCYAVLYCVMAFCVVS